MKTPKTTLPESLRKLIQSTSFFSLRWETDFTPCTGITAVVREERRVFAKLGLLIAPWQSRMATAQAALSYGKVTDLNVTLRLEIFPGVFQPLRLLLANAPDHQPILFLAVDGFFQGDASPYATSGLATDTLVFANAVDLVLREAGAQPHQWIWCADWETGPALLLLRSRHHCALHLHNIYDEFLGHAVEKIAYARADVLRNATVLQAAMREADVVAGVNRGFVWSLQNEPAYTKILASHLQKELARAVPVENANFVPLTPELLALEEHLSNDVSDATRVLRQYKAAARRRLPPEIRRQIKGRALLVMMGRRVTQKMIEVAVESARRTLATNPTFPALWFFATVPGDQHSDQRLESIARLCADHPESAAFSDGRIDYYDALLAAADLILMPSITEPHGGCFQAAVVPVVSARDGLAAQVPAYQASGLAAKLNHRWHGNRPAAGWCVREELPMNGELALAELRQLLAGPPSQDNLTFHLMVEAFKASIEQAVGIWRDEPRTFAQLVREVLRIQKHRSWEMNYGSMFSHIAAAQVRRSLA